MSKRKPETQAPETPTGESQPVDNAGADQVGTGEVIGVDPENAANDEQPAQESGNGPAPSGDEQAGDDQQSVHDEEAPFGRRADGTPAAKRGPKPKSAVDERAKQTARLRSVTPSTARPQKPRPIEVTPLAVVNYQAMGESVASMWFHGGEMIFGEEWAPDTQAGEHLAVAGAFRDYFKATNMRDLPPGFALCFVLGVYSLKRANKPTVKSKLQSIGLWMKHNLRFKR